MFKNINIFIFILLLILIFNMCYNVEHYKDKKKIVVIEPRDHPDLLNLINNIIDNKPEDWDIQIFVGKSMDISKLPKIDKNNNKIIYTKLNSNNLYPHQYNNLFKSINFWNKIDAEYIQIMQTDSALCKNSKFKLDDFIKFPYIGCSSWLNAWSTPAHNIYDKNTVSCLGVGGFSMRKKSVMLECINESTKKLFTGNVNELTEKDAIMGGEDFFFSRCIAEKGLKIPTNNDMIDYCIEYNYNKDSGVPVGIHTSQISKSTAKWLSEKCPEGNFTLNR
jgi:hypothetical protein